MLRAIRPFDAGGDRRRDTVRGQYAAGRRSTGSRCPATGRSRASPPTRAPRPTSPCKLVIDNWRWAGVPFYLRTGKRLPKRVTEIAIQFKTRAAPLFRQTAAAACEPNVLVLRIQPDEGISPRVRREGPGPGAARRAGEHGLPLRPSLRREPPEAYERLLLDVPPRRPDALHPRRDEVEAAWELVTPILDVVGEQPAAGPSRTTRPGTWGPEAARELLARDGRRWRRPELRPDTT